MVFFIAKYLKNDFKYIFKTILITRVFDTILFVISKFSIFFYKLNFLAFIIIRLG